MIAVGYQLTVPPLLPCYHYFLGNQLVPRTKLCFNDGIDNEFSPMAIQMTVVNTVLVCGTVYWLYKIVSTETSVNETLVHDRFD